ncbi:hypothetical protein [Phenylobacterium sp.]|uniref:hypothetical protein n=1 Tax=Phenylobacterium sp. TaxID=1871053 RepID=UPI00120CA59F|nr:hypothetical protein [Phenylobacterium sp.]THD70460.1 MAG: hypothetical protein E8A12_03100 [Phenylobacterium sp.]
MTQNLSVRLRCAAFAAAAIFLGGAVVAHAQDQRRESDDVEPWHAPAHAQPAPHATSSLDATKTTAATLTQQRETRTLATAVFATPAAGQRAADKAAEAYEPPIEPAAPKAEWLTEDGVHFRGKGLELTTPF